jgi:hypothetical protein
MLSAKDISYAQTQERWLFSVTEGDKKGKKYLKNYQK